MPIISQKSPAELLLARLLVAYPTTHVDTAEEQTENIRIVEQALSDGVKPELLVSKLTALSTAHGTRLRYKLHNLLIGKYWESSVQQSTIVARGYQPPKAQNSGAAWSLEP